MNDYRDELEDIKEKQLQELENYLKEHGDVIIEEVLFIPAYLEDSTETIADVEVTKILYRKRNIQFYGISISDEEAKEYMCFPLSKNVNKIYYTVHNLNVNCIWLSFVLKFLYLRRLLNAEL